MDAGGVDEWNQIIGAVLMIQSRLEDDMVEVRFKFDETTNKWSVEVHGAVSDLEAKRAFNAIIISCKPVVVYDKHGVTDCITHRELSPAVYAAGPLFEGGARAPPDTE